MSITQILGEKAIFQGALKTFIQLNIFSILLFSFFSLPVAWGAELHGSLGLRTEYVDNIFLRSSNKQDDTRVTISPSLSFAGGRGNNTLALQYSSKLIYYNEYSRQDRFNHSLNIDGESDPSKKISAGINITDTYRFFYADPRQTGQPVVNEDLAEGNTLIVAPSIRFRVGSTSRAIFGYQYTDRFFKNYPRGRDSEGHKGSFSWEQELGSNAVLSLGYSYFNQQFARALTQQYTGATGYDQNQGQIGLRWQVSPQVSGNVNYSQVWREYDTGRRLNYSNWDATLTTKFFKATELQAGYSQSYPDDVFGRSYKTRRESLTLTQGIGKKLILTLGTSHQETTYQLLNRKSENWSANIGLRADISSKLSLSLRGSYQDWNSKQGASSDDISRELYTARAALAYQVSDWLSFDIRYIRLESVSDTASREYTVNRYSLSVRAAF